MTTSNYINKFSVVVNYGNGLDGKPTRQIDTYQSVKKPLYYTRFNIALPGDAVKLAYAAIDELDSDNNIIIIDRSTAAPENAPQFTQGEEGFSGKTFSSFYKNILITDVFTTAIPTQPEKPLFYKHILAGDIDVDTIYILDSNFDKVNQYLYRIIQHYVHDAFGNQTSEVEYVAIYNDLVNIFDEDMGEFTAYYIQYVDTDGNIQTKLLNNQPVYAEASFNDIDWETGHLKTWLKVYTVSQVGNYYEFIMPNDANYYVRYLEEVRLCVKNPLTDSKELPWFPRITNGSFTHNYNGTLYTYKIAEFDAQNFNPVAPYKFALYESATKLSNSLLKLQHDSVVIGMFPIDIIIRDLDGTFLYALTTNSSKTGTSCYYEGEDTGLLWNDDKVLSYDNSAGIIQVDVELKDYYTIMASYYYEELYYEFNLINLNPLSNVDVLDFTYVIYVIPAVGPSGSYGTTTVSVHYLKVDKSGIITDCSQTEIAEYVIGQPYGRPGQEVGSFIRDYTLEPVGNLSLGNDGQLQRYLVLAELSVVQQSHISDVTILDDRQNGGGIKDDYVAEAKQINPEVTWYGDIGLGGGIPYPGNAAILVRLPHCLLQEYGGIFTDSEILEVVKRHMAFGHYPVIRYYGIVPDISLDDSVPSTEVTILWPSEGSGVTYDVYYTTGNIYSKHNVNPIADNSNGNTYTLTSLTPNSIYKIYVCATRENPCALPNTMPSVCSADTQLIGGSGTGWTSHSGPRSRILMVKVLPALS